MSPTPGQTLLHYRLIEKIGEGGMGVVWKAEDVKLGRTIALKILPDAMAGDPERSARFEREARTVAALNHPNIVTLHSVEEADGVHFLTMELVEGRTLADEIARDGLPLARFLDIAIPLADAVAAAHRAGITHRDLKPDNVMIDEEGRLRVLDFGLAKLIDPGDAPADTQMATVTSDTAEGRIVGTVAYMAPEQAEGKPVDARSDVFSLGTILYEMATGSRPFRGETTVSTISAILKDEPESISDLRSTLPRHAGRIVKRCLAKDPDRRYQTALELRNELDGLRSEVSAPLAATPARRRRPWWPLAAAIVVVAVATWLLTRDDAADAPEIRYEPRPVTATTAYDTEASWSHDGKTIAFSRMTDGNFDIWVQQADATEAVPRVTGPGDQTTPRWSPDGNHIAYRSTQESGSPIFLVSPDGGTPRRVIDTGVPTLSMTPALGRRPWSPDGRYLLVTRARDGGFAVDRVEVATGEATPFTSPAAGEIDLNASYSFDGSRVLFLRGAELTGYRMLVVSADGGEPEPLAETIVGNATWRPGDRRVVYTEGGLTNTDLVELDLDTGERRTLYSRPAFGGLDVSRDDRLLFSDFRHDMFLFEVDVQSGERRQLTSHIQHNFRPVFSPDGGTIAYTSTRTGDPEVWLHRIEDGTETRLTEAAGIDAIGDWSPDGRRIVFLSNRGDFQFRPYVVSVDGTAGARLLVDQSLNWEGPGGAVVAVAQWSPDGTTIGYVVTTSRGASLWSVAPDGTGASERLTGITEFDWYLDDRRVLATRLRGSEKDLLAVHLDTGEERLLFTGAFREIFVRDDGSAVSMCFGRGHLSMGLAALKLRPPDDPDGLPVAIGEPEYVVPTEGTWHVHGGGWSPDGNRLAYIRDWDYGNIHELVEKHRE